MTKQKKGVTRRRFLEKVGLAGGSAALYETMTALGLINLPEAWAGPPELSESSGVGKSVVILGAGIGGLTAAYELTRANYNCQVIELSDRAGGRNHTARRGTVLKEVNENGDQTEQVCNFDEGLYLNLGPGRLPYHHRRVLHYCRELGVALEIYVMETMASLFQSDKAFGGKAQIRMCAGDAHEIKIGPDPRDGLHRRRAHGDDRVFEQPPADQLHFHTRMSRQFHRHPWAVGHGQGFQTRRQMPCEFQRGRAPIQEHDLARTHHAGSGAADRLLPGGGDQAPPGEIHHGRRGGQRPAMHPLQQPLPRQLAQIAPDRVLGQAQFLAERLRHHAMVAPQHVQDVRLALWVTCFSLLLRSGDV